MAFLKQVVRRNCPSMPEPAAPGRMLAERAPPTPLQVDWLGRPRHTVGWYVGYVKTLTTLWSAANITRPRAGRSGPASALTRASLPSLGILPDTPLVREGQQIARVLKRAKTGVNMKNRQKAGPTA